MQVKNNLFIFVNCLIKNSKFELQPKKELATECKHFSSTCPLKDDENFLKKIFKKKTELLNDWLIGMNINNM